MEEAERERIIAEGREELRIEQVARDRRSRIISSIGSFIRTAFIVLSFSGGVGIFVIQVFGYLDAGIWTSLSLANFIGKFYEPWAYSEPKAWIGLWNIIDFIPLSLILIVTGLWITVYLIEE